MAAEKPQTRKTHVYRYIGKTGDGNGNVIDVPEATLDVERIDMFVAEEGAGFDYQLTRLKLQWYAEDTGDVVREPNPARQSKKRKVIPPDEDPDNPSLWFEVDVIDVMTIQDDDLKIRRRFKNLETWRRRRVRRVTHWDTPFDSDPIYAKGGVLKKYRKIERTENEEVYLDVVIPNAFTLLDDDQKRAIEFKNQYLIDATRAPKKTYGQDDVNPPWQLDPFQYVVNVQYSGLEEVMVASGDGFYATSTESKNTKDGFAYIDGFDDNTTTAASGLGMTVAPAAPEMVVFGKPRDGAACFIKITPGTDPTKPAIKRGLSDGKGGVTWTTVGTVSEDSGPVAVSFAGKAFFVSSNNFDTRSFLYVSFDGTTWSKATTAVNPNGGEDGENGQPEGNHVAYNPDTKVYCHTGWFFRAYEYDLVDIDDDTHHTTHGFSVNFWSATSTDGLSWSPKYDRSEFYAGAAGPPTQTGNQGSPGSLYNSVAFGAGVFVAPSVWAIQYDYYNFGGVLNVNQHVINRIDSVGVAVSTDGKNWTNMQLPGAVWDPGIFIFDEGGSGENNRTAINGDPTGIIFCKTGGTDPDTKQPKGFFVVTATESSNGIRGDEIVAVIYRKKRWVSSDGRKWTLAYATDDPTQKPDTALSVHNRNYNPELVVR